MWMKRFSIFLIFLFLPSAYALTIEPSSVLTGCPYNLTEMVWYDFCLTPVEDAIVYYNISFGTVADPSTLSYPSTQTLENKGNGEYAKTLTCKSITGNPPECLWINGTYTASVNVTRVDYENVYDSSNFTVLPDYPYQTEFKYSGDLNYFNVYWKGSYQDESCFPDRELAAECYLNDKPSIPPIRKALARKGGSNTFDGNIISSYNLTKDETVLSPRAASVLNKISCKFYDTSHEWLFSWENQTFRPIDFELAVTSLTATVGKEFSLPLYVKNNGLLADNYTIWVIPQINPQAVSIIFGNTTLNNIKKGETAESYVKLKALTTDKAYINITVISFTGISASQIITLEGGMASLDEFDFVGIIQIIAIASILFAFVYLKKK